MSTATFKEVFTTGECSEICKVSQQTIIRSFDTGRLKGYRVPGSKFRRIPRDALIAYMKEFGIPFDNFPGGPLACVIRTYGTARTNSAIRGALEQLNHGRPYDVEQCETPGEFGFALGERPDIAIAECDEHLGLTHLLGHLRKRGAHTRLILLSDDHGDHKLSAEHVTVLPLRTKAAELLALMTAGRG